MGSSGSGKAYGRTTGGQSQRAERTPMENLFSYLSVLFRYKWMIAVITFVAAVGVVVYSIISLRLPPEESPLPNYYEAYATLLAAEEGGGGTTQAMLSALGIDMPGGASIDYGQIAQQVVQTRSFLDSIIKEHGLIEKYGIEDKVRTNSREILSNSMGVVYDPSTSMLTVSYQDIDPVFAKDMANSIVQHLQEWFQSRGGLSRMQELRSLEDKLAEIEAEIARLETEIQEFQREHGVLNVEEIAETQASMLSDLQSQLVDLEVRIRNQETFSRMEDDPALARLRAERANVIQLINQIENGFAGGAREMPARSELPQLALDFRRLQTDLEIQQRIYQAVSEQYEVARLTAESEPVFTVLELAEVPEEKAGPRRGDLSIRVTLMAFFGSVALAYLLHFARKLMADPEKRQLIADSIAGKEPDVGAAKAAGSQEKGGPRTPSSGAGPPAHRDPGEGPAHGSDQKRA